MPSDEAFAGFVRQDGKLTRHGVNQDILNGATGGLALIKRRAVLVAATVHLRDQQFVAFEQCSGFSVPPECFGMSGVASRAAVHGEDVPQSVQLAVFAEEMLTAQKVRGNVPDPHRVRLASTGLLSPRESSRQPRVGRGSRPRSCPCTPSARLISRWVRRRAVITLMRGSHGAPLTGSVACSNKIGSRGRRLNIGEHCPLQTSRPRSGTPKGPRRETPHSYPNSKSLNAREANKATF